MTTLAYIDEKLTKIDLDVVFPYRRKLFRIGLRRFEGHDPMHVVFVDNYGNITALLKQTAVSLRMYKDLKELGTTSTYFMSDVEIWERLIDDGTLTADDCKNFLSTLRNFFDGSRITEYRIHDYIKQPLIFLR